MAGPPTSSDARLTAVFSGSASPSGAVCTIGVSSGGDILTAEFLDPAALAIESFHKSVSTVNCYLSSVEMKRGPDATGPTFSKSINTQGTGLSPSSPPNTTLLIRKGLLDISGRFSGRFYWPSPPEDKIDMAGVIDLGYLNIVQTAATKLFNDLVTAGLHPMVFTSKPDLPPVLAVNAFEVQPLAATQRRRMRR